MKFQLAPDNRNQSDEVLLADLRSVSALVQSSRMTREEYQRHGRFSPTTIASRFGGWGRALVRAGLVSPRHFHVSAQEAIDDLKRVAEAIGAASVSVQEYKEHGRYSEKPFKRHFRNWAAALAAAGLRPSLNYYVSASDEELFSNMEQAWRTLGRQPKRDDMRPPVSRFAADRYTRRFRTWRGALEAFVAALAGNEDVTPKGQDNGTSVIHIEAPVPPAGGTRAVGWRLRYVVMARDHFTCRACGRSPAKDHDIVLHVDHVLAWSRGGLTVKNNLQTLCDRCDIGKGHS